MNHSSLSGLIRSGVLFFVCAAITLAGCSQPPSETPSEDPARDTETKNSTEISDPAQAALYSSCLEIADIFQDIYTQAFQTGSLDSLETQEEIVSLLGEEGYCVSDADNQLNMANAEKLEDFLASAGAGEEADATVLLVMEGGSVIYYDFQTQGGSISAQRCTLYWDSGSAKAGYYEAFTAEKWCYTESGYFFFDQYRMPGYDGPPGEIGIRVKPLDSDCREYNRKYVIPVGYNRNSVLISDWSESDGFGSLNFYDLYDLMYRMKYGTEAPCPYAYTGAEYEIPASEFDSVLQSYLNISSDTIRSRTVYYPESDTYQYRPRGLEDAEYPYPPYPEVTACETQADGTLKLTVQAVQTTNLTDQAVISELVVRPLADGSFQYVSNHVTGTTEGISGTWFTPRLTEDEWNYRYRSGSY